MLKLLLNLILISSTLGAFSSCKKKSSTPEDIIETPVTNESTLIKIGETYLLGAKAKAVIYANKAFETGYNEVYVSLLDSLDGSKLNNCHFSLSPSSNDGSGNQNLPCENSNDSLAVNGYFASAAIFTKAGAASQCFLNFSIHNHKNNLYGSGSLGVAVLAQTPIKVTSLSTTDNSTFVIALISPATPKVGINDFEIVLQKKSPGSNFAAVEDYKIEIDPVMPSMGHGSPNNVNPTHRGKGHYSGKVNFTMTGLWRVNLKLTHNDSLITSAPFIELSIK